MSYKHEMDFVEIHLRDAELQEEYTLKVSPSDAVKASNGKRKTNNNNIGEVISEMERIEEERKKRHSEKMEAKKVLMEKLDKILEKI